MRSKPWNFNTRLECRLIVTLIFSMSMAFFFLLHWKMPNPWDFHAYLMNGEYFFHHGRYFESGRPPLLPLILGLMEFVSRNFAEFGYIVLASAFFLLTSFRLARSARLNPVYYYAVICGIGFLQRGLNEGTEILALSFLQLFTAALFEDRLAGQWLGLAILARYPSLAFTPFLLFRGKKLWKDLLACFAVLLPWLLYNQLRYGSYLQSFADLYANNFYFRHLLHQYQPWEVRHFLQLLGSMIPFAMVGLYSIRRKLLSRQCLITILIAATVVVFYFRTPFKNARYLFCLLLPVSIWATQGVQWLELNLSRKALTSALVAIFLVNLVVAFMQLGDGRATQNAYRKAIRDIKAHHLSGCDVETNGFVEVSYEGLSSRLAPPQEIAKSEVEGGEVLLIFKWIEDPYYNPRPTFVSSLPVVVENDDYIILAKGCRPAGRFDENYLKQIADYFQKANGRRSEERPCWILFNSRALQRICAFFSV